MTEEKNFTPEQSLAIIQQMMDSARTRFEDNGLMYLVWGSLSTMAGLGHFLLSERGLFPLIPIPYLALWILGTAFNVFYYRNKAGQRGQSNPIGALVRRAWLMVSINVAVMGFFLFSVLQESLTPVILIMLSIGVGVSGAAVRSRLLAGAGVAINLIGMAAFFVDLKYQPLMLSLAATAAMLIPGAVMYMRPIRK